MKKPNKVTEYRLSPAEIEEMSKKYPPEPGKISIGAMIVNDKVKAARERGERNAG